MLRAPGKVTLRLLLRLFYNQRPASIFKITIFVWVSGRPRPQRTNKRTVRPPSGSRTPAHKHRNPQAADCIQIALSAGRKLSFRDQFQSDICRGLVMKAASEWLSCLCTVPRHLTLCGTPKVLVYCFFSITKSEYLHLFYVTEPSHVWCYSPFKLWDRGHLVSLWIPHNMGPMWQEERAARDTFRMPASSYQNTLPYVTHNIEILAMLV